jgi:hypothetical protein
MILGDVGAVHAQSRLIKKHPEKASRDHSLKEGPEFSLALSSSGGSNGEKSARFS